MKPFLKISYGNFLATFFWAVLLGLNVHGASISWSGSGDGVSWTDANNWVGGVVPGAIDDVTIGAISANPTIKITSPVQVNSVTSMEPITVPSGSLQVSTTLQTAQVFTLSGGTIKGGTFITTGTGTLALSSGTLDGVTLGSDLTVSGSLTVKNGLTLNSIKLTLKNGTFTFSGTQTLGGTGEVIVNGSGGLYAKGDGTLAGAAVLTLAGGITVHNFTTGYNYAYIQGTYTYDSVVNQGTLSADSTGQFTVGGATVGNQGTIRATNGADLLITNLTDAKGLTVTGTSSELILSGTWTNTGSLTATNSTLWLRGTWSNSGNIAVTNTALQLDGTMTLASLGSIVRTGGTVELLGTLDLAGQTLALSAATGSWSLKGGTIKGGAITGAGGAALMLATGTLDGMTLNSDTPVTDSIVIKNGLTLNAKLTFNNSGYAKFFFPGSQFLAGSGEVFFNGGGVLNFAGDGTQAGAATLTLGPNITVHGGGYFGGANGGQVNSQSQYDSIINQGTIKADTSGATITVRATSVINQGTMQASNGGNLTVYNLTDAKGLAISGGGTLELDGAWINTGSITVTNSKLNLGGNLTKATMGTIIRQNSTVTLTGVLDNTGQTLTLDSTTGSWALQNGTIKGGTVTTAGGVTLILTNGTLDGVTLDCDATLTGYLTILDGLTLNSTLTLNGGTILYDGTQSITGTGMINVTHGANIEGESDGTQAGAALLTLGPNITLLVSQNGSIYGGFFQYDSEIMQGSLQLTSGGTFSIVEGNLLLNGQGTYIGSPDSVVDSWTDLLGNSTAIGASNPQGTTILDGEGTVTSPQLLEAMSQDQGNVAAGYSHNFVFGTLIIAKNDNANDNYVQLVDQFHNSPSTGADAVYAQSISVAANCTLDLNGLHLYARCVELDGTVVNGTITQMPDSGPLALNTFTPGTISVSGELDEWTFSARGGGTVTVAVNPGSGNLPAPIAPQLQWVSVQLLDANNNVLATSASAAAGEGVTLANIALPADGTYKIQVKAPAAQAACTGNYLVGVYDTTPRNVLSLNMGEPSNGSVDTPFSQEPWKFSAVAGQQVQFHLLAVSSPGIAFTLSGPNGEILFKDLTSDSQLVDLPVSGTYTINAHGLSVTTGSYRFRLDETSVTPLALGTPYMGTWIGSGQAQLFSIPVTTNNPLSINLSDSASLDHSEVYIRFGAPPTRQTYDYAANGSGSSQRLLVPTAAEGTWYVLVYGESIASSSGGFTLQADSREIILTSTSLSKSAVGLDSTITLTGAGFKSGTNVTLLAADGTTSYSAANSTVDFPGQITAIFSAGSVPVGTYSIVVTQTDGAQSQLPASFTLFPTAVGGLSTHLEIPNPIGRHIAAIIYIDYANTGTAPIPAPLLILSATNPSGKQGAYMTLDGALQTRGFWTSATPYGYSQSVEILASGAIPGVLAPGESMRVPVYYGGWTESEWDFDVNTLNFSLTAIKPDNSTPVDWASLETSMQPNGISSTAWHTMYTSLVSQLGTTSGGFVQLLDNQATYLGRLGRKVTDVSTLWSFAIAQTENIWPLPSFGEKVDDSLPMPGALSLSFGRAFDQTVPGRFRSGLLGLGWFTSWQMGLTVAADGTVTIARGDGGQSIYQPDSRHPGQYFTVGDDHSVLTAINGGYQVTALNGSITGFNSDGTLGYLQDGNGNKITAGYTGGKLVSLTASSGQFLNLAYNGAGLISTITDSLGRVTTYNYDGASQHLLSVASFNGQVTSYTYDTASGSPSLNTLTSIQFPDNTHQNFSYDNQGRLAGISAEGNAMAKTFNYQAGEVSFTDAASNTSSIFFNEEGQLAKKVDALGNPTYYQYDDDSKLEKVTDAHGAAVSFLYDSVGNATSLEDHLGNITNFVFAGAHNQRSSLTDAKGNTTQYAYNAAGNLLRTTYANGTSEGCSYDPVGNALSYTNAAGQQIQASYNNAGQITTATFSDGTSYTYAYDAQGLPATATDSAGTTTFTYDPTTTFLTKVAYPNGSSLAFTYDAGGRRIRMVDQSGYTIKYSYDALGRLVTLNDANNQLIVSYGYDATGRLNQKTNGNGTYSTIAYDGNGQVIHLINYAPGGGINSRFDYTYDEVGQETTQTTPDGAWTYTYDANSELIHAVFASNSPGTIPNQDLIYSYDAMGNRMQMKVNGTTTTYATDSMNRYTTVGTASCSYDAKGNLLSDGVNTYTYSVLNQMVSSTNGSASTTFAYNALGQRISSTTGGQKIQYINDPSGIGNVVGTLDGNNNPLFHYNYGLGLTSQVSGGATHYHEFDALGNTVGMSDSTGADVNKYAYLPFGESSSTSVTVPNPFQFLGRLGVQTAPSQNLFMRARTYSSAMGRFLSDDPSRLVGGDPNFQRYCFNNPVGFVDPLGLCTATEQQQQIVGVTSDVLSAWGANLARLGITFGKKFFAISGLFGLSFNLVNLGIDIVHGNGLGIVKDLADVTLGVLGVIAADNPYVIMGTLIAAAVELVDDLQKCPEPKSNPMPKAPPSPPGGTAAGTTTTNTVAAIDPNAIYGPAGYGAANYVTNLGNTFAYRIMFENDKNASAPAQSVTVTNNLDPNLDWSTFQLTGIGFGDNNLVIPEGTQHYQKTISMTYNGETFVVEMEAGIHSDTGQVYVVFQSLNPDTGLPPSNVLTGFLPPEDGTGRGQGYLGYTVSPKVSIPPGTVIPNVAVVTFDNGVSIATNQVSETDSSLGTDPTKEARVAIDSGAPVAQMSMLPSSSPTAIHLSWSGTDDNGPGIASYTVYVSSDGGSTYHALVSNTAQTSTIFNGLPSTSYAFYVAATDVLGNIQQVDPPSAAVTTTTQVGPSLETFSQWEASYSISSPAEAAPLNDGVPNLLKYLCHIDPTQPMTAADLASLPAFNRATNGDLSLTFREYALVTGITLNVETSSDLKTWTPRSQSQTASATTYSLQQINTDANTNDPIMEIDAKPSNAPRQFIRLNVTLP